VQHPLTTEAKINPFLLFLCLNCGFPIGPHMSPRIMVKITEMVFLRPEKCNSYRRYKDTLTVAQVVVKFPPFMEPDL
jgi:hypothetical protein